MTKLPRKFKPLFERGVVEIINKNHFIKSLKSGRRLRVKLGIDPTTSELHLGHAVLLRKLKQFQDLGHKIILIIGDFTALVGDPSERATGRPALTPKQIKNNLKTFKNQADKILDLKKTEIHFNSEWFGDKKFNFFLELGRKFTLGQLVEREDIQTRMKKGQAISVIEIIYPMLQGYDSVMVKADIELGGTDQRLNLLFGREMQKHYRQRPQDILMMKYLVGLDGKKKMSKTYNNAISLKDKPNDIFGKLMSINDELVPQYFELLTEKSIKKTASGAKAKELKLNLAYEIVKQLYSEKEAFLAQDKFVKTFVKREVSLARSVKVEKRIWRLDELLIRIKAASSKSEAQRLIKQKAVEIDGRQQVDWRKKISILKPVSIRVGKHKFYKVKLN